MSEIVSMYILLIFVGIVIEYLRHLGIQATSKVKASIDADVFVLF